MKKIGMALLALFVILAGLLYTTDKPIEEMKAIYANAESEFVDIQGLSAHYRREGAGMPLLLIHGSGSFLQTWDAWTDLLKDKFEIIRVDLPGHGLTGPYPDGDYSYDKYIAFLHEFTHSIGLDSFHIAGNSFGGALAFSYAGTYPDRVDKLILIDAAGLDRPKDAEPPGLYKIASHPILSVLMKKVTPRSFIAKNMKEVYGDDTKVTEEMITMYHDFATQEGNRQAFVDRIQQPFPSIQYHFSNLEEPTLILWGDQDEWISVDSGNKMDGLIPNSKLIIYPGVGHLPMEEAPTVSAADAAAFLLDH